MRLNRSSLIVVMLLLFSVGLISAQPFTNGYEIKIPQQQTLKQNQEYTFNFNVLNISNGVPIDNSSTDCFFHLDNSSGNHILKINLSYEPSNVFNEWKIEVNGNNFSEIGKYSYIIQCNSETNQLGGSESVGIEITSTGENLGLASGIIILGQISVMFLFFGLARSFEKEKWKLKMFFDVLALLLSVLVLNSIRIIVTQSANLSTMGERGLILGIIVLLFIFLYMFILALKEVFEYFKSKENLRWT